MTRFWNSESDDEKDFSEVYPESKLKSETSDDDSNSEDFRSRSAVNDSREGSRSTGRRGRQNVNTLWEDSDVTLDPDLDSIDLSWLVPELCTKAFRCELRCYQCRPSQLTRLHHQT